MLLRNSLLPLSYPLEHLLYVGGHYFNYLIRSSILYSVGYISTSWINSMLISLLTWSGLIYLYFSISLVAMVHRLNSFSLDDRLWSITLLFVSLPFCNSSLSGSLFVWLAMVSRVFFYVSIIDRLTVYLNRWKYVEGYHLFSLVAAVIPPFEHFGRSRHIHLYVGAIEG